MQKLLERHRGAFLGRLQPVVMPRLRTLELTGSFRGVPLEAVVAQLRRGGELLPANDEFNAIGVRMRIKRADGFCSLVVEVEPFSGVYWLETVLWPVTADAFDEVLITSAQPLETVSLAVSTHSRMK